MRLVREFAKKQHSTAPAQLAQRTALAMRLSTEAGEDPFVKLRCLIAGIIGPQAELRPEGGRPRRGQERPV